MWLIGLTISLFNIIKAKVLECVSVVNQKCMPRPKILDVNEGVGEALFYPYNIQVNKCSGSCNTLDNPMAKLCVPNVIKGINIQVYNFLTMLNETRNVLWHESCKCVLDHKNCVCKIKLVGRIIEECTSVGNNNTLRNIFIGLFSVAVLIVIICFCVFAYFKWFKGKKLFKNKYADY